MLDWTNFLIIIAAALVVVSVLTSLISFRIGAPLLLVFLLVGLLAGEDGPGGIVFDNAGSAYLIGSIALAVILFDSGFETRKQTLRTAAAPAGVLSTFGVVLTTAVVGVAARFFLGLTWAEGFLMGAIVSSTDAAAVFFLLRVGGINIRERVRSTLEVESGSNDPAAIFLTIALVEVIAAGTAGGGAIGEFAAIFGAQIGLGTLFGVVGGVAVLYAVNRIDLEPALYPILVIAMVLLLFGMTSALGGSGFLAVYIAGLISGNAGIRHALSLRRFQRGMTWLAQIAMFLTLGLLATPSEFPDVLLPAIGIALVLIFIGRPLAVWLCLLPFRYTPYETAFVSWVGLRGAVSILLAIVPALGGLPNGQIFFNVAFLIVLTSLLVQGWTIGLLARWLRLVVPQRTGPVERIELELPGRGDHEVVTYSVHPDSAVGRGTRVPRWARPALIYRDGASLRPHNAGRLRPRDQVYIVTASEHVRLLDDLFARPGGEAADSLVYGDFIIDPAARVGDVAAAYGVGLVESEAATPVAAYIAARLGPEPEPGDRVPFGSVELVIRSIDDKHGIDEVGLAIEPAIGPPRLPLFQGRREIAAAFGAWRARAGTRAVARQMAQTAAKTTDAAARASAGVVADATARVAAEAAAVVTDDGAPAAVEPATLESALTEAAVASAPPSVWDAPDDAPAAVWEATAPAATAPPPAAVAAGVVSDHVEPAPELSAPDERPHEPESDAAQASKPDDRLNPPTRPS